DPGHHVVARPELGHGLARLLHHAEALVPGDQEVDALWRGAVLAGVDLLVGPVQADPDHPDQHSSASLDLIQPRLGDLPEMGAVRLAGDDGDGLHVRSFRVARWMMRSATRPVQPVWCEAPSPAPVSPWKYSLNSSDWCQAGSDWNFSAPPKAG